MVSNASNASMQASPSAREPAAEAARLSVINTSRRLGRRAKLVPLERTRTAQRLGVKHVHQAITAPMAAHALRALRVQSPTPPRTDALNASSSGRASIPMTEVLAETACKGRSHLQTELRVSRAQQLQTRPTPRMAQLACSVMLGRLPAKVAEVV